MSDGCENHGAGCYPGLINFFEAGANSFWVLSAKKQKEGTYTVDEKVGSLAGVTLSPAGNLSQNELTSEMVGSIIYNTASAHLENLVTTTINPSVIFTGGKQEVITHPSVLMAYPNLRPPTFEVVEEMMKQKGISFDPSDSLGASVGLALPGIGSRVEAIKLEEVFISAHRIPKIIDTTAPGIDLAFDGAMLIKMRFSQLEFRNRSSRNRRLSPTRITVSTKEYWQPVLPETSLTFLANHYWEQSVMVDVQTLRDSKNTANREDMTMTTPSSRLMFNVRICAHPLSRLAYGRAYTTHEFSNNRTLGEVIAEHMKSTGLYQSDAPLSIFRLLPDTRRINGAVRGWRCGTGQVLKGKGHEQMGSFTMISSLEWEVDGYMPIFMISYRNLEGRFIEIDTEE